MRPELAHDHSFNINQFFVGNREYLTGGMAASIKVTDSKVLTVWGPFYGHVPSVRVYYFSLTGSDTFYKQRVVVAETAFFFRRIRVSIAHDGHSVGRRESMAHT